jgi:alpha-glucoside transport system permease protein
LFDSAAIDGASSVQILLRIVLPLSVPALASIAIFQFLWVWNDLFVALMYLGGSPEVRPLTVSLSTLVGSRGEGWELLTAAAFISSAVPLFVFFVLQRYFIRGMLAGSIKA